MAARYLWLPRSHPEDPRAMPLTRLMAATDGSDHGDHAVDFALGLAAATGADLRVLGVETDGLPGAAPTRSPARPARTAGPPVRGRAGDRRAAARRAHPLRRAAGRDGGLDGLGAGRPRGRDRPARRGVAGRLAGGGAPGPDPDRESTR